MSSAPFLPKSLLSTSRSEFYDADGRKPEERSLLLTVKDKEGNETELPPGLQGSFFIVAPAGSEDSPPVVENSKTVLPTRNGWTHLLNGDGMVYRVDFAQTGAKYSSRFMETVTYLADKISHQKYPDLAYFNFGISRLSIFTGACNQANTAFLPISGGEDKPDRLLVTWDMGRPVEIDPVSLRVIAPIGKYSDWQPMQKVASSVMATKMLMSCAHPVVIPETNEVLTLNVVKSLRGLMSLPRLLPYILQNLATDFLLNAFLRKILKRVASRIELVINFLIGLAQLFGWLDRQDLFIINWDAKTDTSESWQVVLQDGSSVKLKQTSHQMGLTEDYVVFADTAFKIIVEDLIPSLSVRELKELNKAKKKIVAWLKLLRDYSTFPLLTDTAFYFIHRDQFKKSSSEENKVVATKVVLPGAAIAHFEVDHQNPNDEVTIHAALNQSTDFAEFIHSEDEPVSKNQKVADRMREMAGVFTGAMEVNRPATFVVDVKAGEVDHKATISTEQAEKYTWALGICTYSDTKPTRQFDDVYWTSFGAWSETVSEFMYEMYQDQYKNDPQRWEKFLRQVEEGKPTSLVRIHIDRQHGQPSLSVADTYEFPANETVTYFGNSPQFIPKASSTDSTDGYIVCTVNYSDELLSKPLNSEGSSSTWSANSEIWVFDAADLAKGPLCKLSHADMNFGMTVHTTWLPEIASPAEQREYKVREDFAAQVERSVKFHSRWCNRKEAKQLEQLFEEVYQQVEQSQS